MAVAGFASLSPLIFSMPSFALYVLFCSQPGWMKEVGVKRRGEIKVEGSSYLAVSFSFVGAGDD